MVNKLMGNVLAHTPSPRVPTPHTTHLVDVNVAVLLALLVEFRLEASHHGLCELARRRRTVRLGPHHARVGARAQDLCLVLLLQARVE